MGTASLETEMPEVGLAGYLAKGTRADPVGLPTWVARMSDPKRGPFKGALKAFSNDIESEGLFRTSGNSKSLFLRFLALVEVFDYFSPQNRIQHVELL